MKSINLDKLRKIEKVKRKLVEKISQLDDGTLAYEIAYRAYIFALKKSRKIGVLPE